MKNKSANPKISHLFYQLLRRPQDLCKKSRRTKKRCCLCLVTPRNKPNKARKKRKVMRKSYKLCSNQEIKFKSHSLWVKFCKKLETRNKKQLQELRKSKLDGMQLGWRKRIDRRGRKWDLKRLKVTKELESRSSLRDKKSCEELLSWSQKCSSKSKTK